MHGCRSVLQNRQRLVALHSWPWVACSHSHASLGTVWKSLVITNDNQRNFLCLPLRALHLLVPPALHQRPAGSSGHLGWCWWAHPSSGHSLQPSGGEGRRGDGRRWEAPSQPSCHSCWCEHTRLSRARWRSLACSCHCERSDVRDCVGYDARGCVHWLRVLLVCCVCRLDDRAVVLLRKDHLFIKGAKDHWHKNWSHPHAQLKGSTPSGMGVASCHTCNFLLQMESW